MNTNGAAQIIVLDSVLAQIERHIAAHPPERGGALLGPIGRWAITGFVFDPQARVSRGSYNASSELTDLIHAAERADQSIEFKGIVHSHPGMLDRPSSQDHRAFAHSLTLTPWLGRFIAPIVTTGTAHSSHEIPLRSGKLSFFFAEPGDDGIAVRPAATRAIPISRDAAHLAELIGGTGTGRVMHKFDAVYGLVYRVEIDVRGSRATLCVGDGYPAIPPVVTLQIEDITFPIDVRWNPGESHSQRLERVGSAINRSLKQSIPTVPGPDSPSTVGLDGHQSAEIQAATSNRPKSVRAGIDQRVGAALGTTLHDKRVLVVGCGSVGSHAADMLARAGVEYFWLVDPDRVGPENLSRTVYTSSDLGLFRGDRKTAALARHLRRINPSITAIEYSMAFERLGADRLRKMLNSADLVFCGADDPLAQYDLNHWAYSSDTPAVFVGIYRRGHGGEVVVSLPGITHCYRCAVPVRGHEAARDTNYGTGQLEAEPALGADIIHITTAGVKAAIAALTLDRPASPPAQWLLDALADPTSPRSYAITSTVSDYWFFPDIFTDVAAQGAYQTVWMAPSGDPTCPVCGEHPTEPTLSTTIDLSDLTKLAGTLGRSRPRGRAAGERG